MYAQRETLNRREGCCLSFSARSKRKNRESQVKKLRETRKVYPAYGTYDLLIEVEFNSTKELDAFVFESSKNHGNKRDRYAVPLGNADHGTRLIAKSKKANGASFSLNGTTLPQPDPAITILPCSLNSLPTITVDVNVTLGIMRTLSIM